MRYFIKMTLKDRGMFIPAMKAPYIWDIQSQGIHLYRLQFNTYSKVYFFLTHVSAILDFDDLYQFETYM